MPRKFEDFTAPAEMSDEELDSWADWLDEEVAECERYIKHLQARIVLRKADLARLARAMNAATTQEEHNKLAMEHMRIGGLLDDAWDELNDAVKMQDKLKAAMEQVKAELEWRDLINP